MAYLGSSPENGVKGYFGLLKRGIKGVYHHVGQQHLHRYLSEFDFRGRIRTADVAGLKQPQVN